MLDGIDELRESPYNSKQLKGLFKGTRRIKIGNYRIIFIINECDKPKNVRVIKIGHRKNIYKIGLKWIQEIKKKKIKNHFLKYKIYKKSRKKNKNKK